jgi:hypothetical protein
MAFLIMDKERDDQKEVKRIREGNISLILYTYHDIFSSFDPRPTAERALSDDFLSEVKRAAFDKGDKIELRLLLPRSKRSYNEEVRIKLRLKEHFRKAFKEKHLEKRRMQAQGFLWFLLGALVMFFESYWYNVEGSFLLTFLKIMATPAGWFFFWEGLDKVFIYANENKREYNFNKKMSEANIIFSDYQC